jgi:2-polyprenyl-3-methyl-5-hydroxy-6-metoxy-1,4-benzoquinol methylase
MGLWQKPLEQAFPRARYVGVEYSTYLCERLGWTHGSVVDYRATKPFDLVVCQGVLPYLSTPDARRALANLAQLCSGALYLEAVTREDRESGVLDTERTDPGMHLRPRSFYLRALAPHFQAVGGGLFVARSAGVPLYALERT